VGRSRRPVWPFITGAVLLLAIVGAAVVLLTGGDDKSKTVNAQTVRFQQPTSDGPDPFTKPADVRGGDRVKVGSGPFGGTGSDLVCDRELLIRSLRARPDRMREWARVLQIEPNIAAVARYIRKLRPVTLTRDTRVTNHSFVNGRAVPYQAILQAGTAVLVDKDGKPVARCRCGNPLLEPTFFKEAKCFGCPAHYRPPPPCDYYDYDDGDYDSYDDGDYKSSYDPADYRGKCYAPYLDPPQVKRRRPPQPAAPAAQEPPPPATSGPQTTPQPTLNCDAPSSQLEFEQCRDQQQPTPQETPDAPSNFECPDQPPAHPGEDYLRYCG
jgi:uncharacterized protein DUF6777